MNIGFSRTIPDASAEGQLARRQHDDDSAPATGFLALLAATTPPAATAHKPQQSTPAAQAEGEIKVGALAPECVPATTSGLDKLSVEPADTDEQDILTEERSQPGAQLVSLRSGVEQQASTDFTQAQSQPAFPVSSQLFQDARHLSAQVAGARATTDSISPAKPVPLVASAHLSGVPSALTFDSMISWPATAGSRTLPKLASVISQDVQPGSPSGETGQQPRVTAPAALAFGDVASQLKAAQSPTFAKLASTDEAASVATQILQAVAEVGAEVIRLREPRSLRVRLRPEELGEIDINITSDHTGSLSVRLSAARDTTHSTLADGLGQLREALEQAGLNVARLDVGPGQTAGSGAQASAGRQQESMPHAGVVINSPSTPETNLREGDGGEREEKLLSLRA